MSLPSLQLFTSAELPAEEVFAHALRGEPTYLIGPSSGPPTSDLLPVADWTRAADVEDRALLRLCRGSTLDIGCGPGRLTEQLGLLGHVTLGIDLVYEAVQQTVRRGAPALRRDVFGPVPGEGRWDTTLLADGNIGIGGDPTVLLGRVRRLLAPGGRIVVEVGPPGVRSVRFRARLGCDCGTSDPFSWAIVGVDDIATLASRVGLVVAHRTRLGERWAVVLEEP
ncbi:methyltransferase domain-containing protein [Nocardioides sp. Iso805N]|uniref:methyltransferase domain-containing protein n=1 Tax=Nocardioides sp. Iso805N TaxID=1283287 RepID=UPI000380884D|nr:methyltransferase domain-containing protein [Nocardioides sp. Iso805N]